MQYSKDDLRHVERDEAVFFLMACQLYNDISVMYRLVLSHSIRDEDPEPVRAAATTTQLMVIRLLAGRCVSGWDMVKTKFQHYFSAYGAEIDDGVRKQFAELRSYFGQGSLLADLRNQLAFHSDFDNIAAAFETLPGDEPLTDFHQQARGNTVYFGADTVLTQALVNLTGEADRFQALAKIGDEVLRVSGTFMDVASAFSVAFCARHLPNKLEEMASDMITVEDQANVYVQRASPFVFIPKKERPARGLKTLGSRLAYTALAGPLIAR